MIPQDWRPQLEGWLALHSQARWAIHDFDADGICAAALWYSVTSSQLLCVNSRQHLPAPPAQAQALALLDLSCPAENLPWNLPTVVIDHHPLPPQPASCLLLSSADWQPSPCTALLVHALLLGEDSPRAWVAAVGALSDLGDQAPFDLLQNQLGKYGKNSLQQVVSLVNSPHRMDGDCQQAVTALLEHDKPNHLLRSKHPAVTYLRDCQAQVKREIHLAHRAQPHLLNHLAILEISSPCSVQSLLAQTWRTRLPDHLILAANRRPDRPEVQISARARRPVNVIEGFAPFGLQLRGHPSSAGAVLRPEQWEQVKANLKLP